MKEMTSREMLDSVEKALAEVDSRLVSGELDGSGRYYSDEELAAGAATGRIEKQAKKKEAPAA
jgi:hypothetical protein